MSAAKLLRTWKKIFQGTFSSCNSLSQFEDALSSLAQAAPPRIALRAVLLGPGYFRFQCFPISHLRSWPEWLMKHLVWLCNKKLYQLCFWMAGNVAYLDWIYSNGSVYAEPGVQVYIIAWVSFKSRESDSHCSTESAFNLSYCWCVQPLDSLL